MSITFVTPKEDRRIPSYEDSMGREVEKVSRKKVSDLQLVNPELRKLHEEKREDEFKNRSDRRAREGRDKVKAVIKKEKSQRLEESKIISLNIGKSAGTTRGELVSYVSGAASIPIDAVGRIGLSGSSSFVEVDAQYADRVIRAVNQVRLNGKKVKATYAPEKVKCKDKLPKKK